MSQEVSQWLTEIQTLRQQLAELQNERDTVWESAQKWRELYTTEGQQRRTEAKLAAQAIATLKAEIQQLQGMPQIPIAENAEAKTAVQQEVEQVQSVAELQEKLVSVILERDRLLQALKTEQANHAQTRKSLTTALADAIDRLTRERTAQQKEGVGGQGGRGALEQGRGDIEGGERQT